MIRGIERKMNRIKKVNETYLLTILAAVGASIAMVIVSAVLGIYEVVTDELMALLVSQAILFLPTGVYLLRNKFNLKETIRLKRIKISTVPMLIGFMYAVMPAATLINAISLKFTTNVIDDTVTQIAANYPFVIGMTAVAFIPAVLEESVYRGVFYNEYRKVDVKKAVVLSGLLFGLAHMNLNQFIYAFLLGMVFSIVVEVTDSILSSMVLHFIMNGSSMISVYAQEMAEVQETMEEVDAIEVIDTYIQSIWFIALVGVLLACFILRMIAKNEGREQVWKELFGRKKGISTEYEQEISEMLSEGTELEEYVRYPEQKLGTMALWIGMFFSAGMMLLVELTK